MHAILVHGMGRSAASMRPLARCLRRAGVEAHRFSYFAAWESLETCITRLQKFIALKTRGEPFVVVGHSLGTVLLRLVLPKLSRSPEACFFLAPPAVACRAAKYFKKNPLFRLITGKMGQLLSDESFMSSLPALSSPTYAYIGIRGPRGHWSPFGWENNDGILAVSEATLEWAHVEHVHASHTFIMNSQHVMAEIVTIIGKGDLMNAAYINSPGAVLPSNPISRDDMEKR